MRNKTDLYASLDAELKEREHQKNLFAANRAKRTAEVMRTFQVFKSEVREYLPIANRYGTFQKVTDYNRPWICRRKTLCNLQVPYDSDFFDGYSYYYVCCLSKKGELFYGEVKTHNTVTISSFWRFTARQSLDLERRVKEVIDSVMNNKGLPTFELASYLVELTYSHDGKICFDQPKNESEIRKEIQDYFTELIRKQLNLK